MGTKRFVLSVRLNGKTAREKYTHGKAGYPFCGIPGLSLSKKPRKEGKVWRGNHQGSPLRVERSGSKPPSGGRKWGRIGRFPPLSHAACQRRHALRAFFDKLRPRIPFVGYPAFAYSGLISSKRKSCNFCLVVSSSNAMTDEPSYA